MMFLDAYSRFDAYRCAALRAADIYAADALRYYAPLLMLRRCRYFDYAAALPAAAAFADAPLCRRLFRCLRCR